MFLFCFFFVYFILFVLFWCHCMYFILSKDRSNRKNIFSCTHVRDLKFTIRIIIIIIFISQNSAQHKNEVPDSKAKYNLYDRSQCPLSNIDKKLSRNMCVFMCVSVSYLHWFN